MDEQIKIMSETILEFQDSGRTSTTAMARCIIGVLKSKGFILSKSESIDSKIKKSKLVCDNCVEGLSKSKSWDIETCIHCRKKIDSKSHVPNS